MLTWQWKRFEQLSVEQIYDILRVRQEVFILEQSCLYKDIDNRDNLVWYLMGYDYSDPDHPALCAYLRVFGPGIKFKEISLGRVLTIETGVMPESGV